jgi:cytochrome c oxidase subunit 1
MYNERLGKLHFFIMLPAFYVQSLGQMQIGLLGMRRRIADYDPALGIDTSQLLITIAGYLIGIAVLVAIYNFIASARRGEVALANPWRSRSPEWQVASPMPEHNYAVQPQVVGEPYDYGLAGSVFVTMNPESEPGEPGGLVQAPAAAD